MKRVVAALGVVVLPVLHVAPAAEAGLGAGTCVINGQIRFSPANGPSGQGMWQTESATIECHGLIYGLNRLDGRGPFAGSGSLGPLSAGTGPCMLDLGPGSIDYTIPTTMGDLRIVEPIAAGLGFFTSRNMSGSFQLIPPYEGGCAVNPFGRATFMAEGIFTRRDAQPPALP